MKEVLFINFWREGLLRVFPGVYSAVGGDGHVNALTPFSEEIAWNPTKSVSSYYTKHVLVCFF